MTRLKNQRPISEAERRWMDEQGDYGRRCFAYSSDTAPKNNVFSLAYYRNTTTIISLPPLNLDKDSDE